MSNFTSHFFCYQFPAILWGIIIFVLSAIPSSKFPVFDIWEYDKFIHAGVFFVFGLLVYRALELRMTSASISWNRILWSVVTVVLYGLLTELYQGSVPGRTLDLRDAVADAVGGILSAIVIFLYTRKKSNEMSSEI
ncbi:MAG: VanZ family protein [Ignavibacteriae bacterium]|nr:VanZ family protein [Ignavibacteriota bacterium]